MSHSLRHHARLLCPWDIPGKNTGAGCHSLLRGIFLTQGSNSVLLHWWQILYPLGTREAHKRSVVLVKWVSKWMKLFYLIISHSVNKICFHTLAKIFRDPPQSFLGYFQDGESSDQIQLWDVQNLTTHHFLNICFRTLKRKKKKKREETAEIILQGWTNTKFSKPLFHLHETSSCMPIPTGS